MRVPTNRMTMTNNSSMQKDLNFVINYKCHKCGNKIDHRKVKAPIGKHTPYCGCDIQNSYDAAETGE